MLDIRIIRERPLLITDNSLITDYFAETSGAGDQAKVDEVLSLDEKWRKHLIEVEQLKAQRNRISKEADGSLRVLPALQPFLKADCIPASSA